MFSINVNDKEYNVKFGYKAVTKSNLLKKIAVQAKESENLKGPEMIESILEFLPFFLLIGLQRNHADEFGYNYNDGESQKEAMEKVDDLLDEYFNEEGNDVFVLYGKLNDELMDNGFLSSLLQKEQENVAQEKPKKSQK